MREAEKIVRALVESVGGESNAQRVEDGSAAYSLGVEQAQTALAEALTLAPRPGFLIFVALDYDPVTSQFIAEFDGFQDLTLLQVVMNPDLFTDDLKKGRRGNESFWLVGQPDVELREAGENGKGEKQFQVEVLGFDYYNVKEGAIESGGTNRIAVWMLDTNYDGRSLFPHQVFFPMAGEKDGWSRLAKNLKAEIDEEKIEAYRGTVSLPFTVGSHGRVAVKIVDDRGIESVRLIEFPSHVSG
jgi:adenine-specific DNA-methyltransferase